MFALNEVKPDDLAALTQKSAVSLIRNLLWAECSRVGVEKNLIEAPRCINSPEGGLDACIGNFVDPSSDELIPRGVSGFQIKTAYYSPAVVAEILHKDEDKYQVLQIGIQRILHLGGTYVLILLGNANGYQGNSGDYRAEIINELEKCGRRNPRVRVYSIFDVVKFVNHHPALVAGLTGNQIFRNYQKWEDNLSLEFKTRFILDEKRAKAISEIRKIVTGKKAGNQPTVVRVTGDPGVGKTRLLFEALGPDNLKNRVIYVDKNFPLGNSQLLADKIIETVDDSTIAVIDNCPALFHEEMVGRLSQRRRKSVIITLSHNEDESRDQFKTVNELHVDPLPLRSIASLISTEIAGVPARVVNKIAVFSGGCPRYAILFARFYRESMDKVSQIFQKQSSHNLQPAN